MNYDFISKDMFVGARQYMTEGHGYTGYAAANIMDCLQFRR